MDARQIAATQSYEQAVQCIKRHSALEAAAQRSSHWPQLQHAVAQLKMLRHQQAYDAAHAKQLTATEKDLASAVRSSVLTAYRIANVARPNAAFESCNTNTSTDDVRLTARTTAALIAADPEPFMALATADFPAKLEDAADALDAVVEARATAAVVKEGVKAAIEEALRAGADGVSVLDAILLPDMTTVMRAEWKAATALGRTHRGRARNGSPERDPATQAIAAPVTETPPPVLTPPPAQKQLPLLDRLNAIIIRLTTKNEGREHPVEIRPDVVIEEIRRLPRTTGD
jgi:hypothetical protein